MTADADTQVTDLTVNDHACLTFGEPAELLDLTTAFVRDGLASGLRVVWLTDTPPHAMAELGRRGIAVEPAVAAGRMMVAPCRDGLLAGQVFKVGHAMGWLRSQLALSEQYGHPGLRLALDMGWALRPVTGVGQLPAFEKELATAVAGAPLSVLCQYDRDRFDPVTLASVAPFHSHSVAAATYHYDPVLRICRQYAPPGIRLAGQLDESAAEALALALAEAIRVDGDITINMAELTFIDVSSTRMIIDAACGLARPRTVVLSCHPAIGARFVLLGATDLPHVSLVAAHDT